MTALPELAQGDAEIQKILNDASIGHRTAARMINAHKQSQVTSEKSVRRFRKSKTSAESLTSPYSPSSPRPKPAAGGGVSWTPRIEVDPAVGGEFYSTPQVVGADNSVEREEAELLAEFDLDPEVWKIEWARKSKWQRADGEWLEAHRVSFRRRGTGIATSVADVDAIMSQYMDPIPSQASGRASRIIMVASGDLQLGKQEGGGTAATVERFCRITDEIAEMLADYDPTQAQALILPWLGDCIEGIVSQNSRMLTTLDIPITEQVRVYRRLMMHQLAKLARYAEQVIVPVIPGNHDETTRVQMMPVTDSWAIEGASAVADWMDGRPGYGHVQFVFPEPGEQDITLDLGTENPFTIGFTHGHVVNRPAGMLDWWKGQSHGRQPIGRADLLVTAHFHHLQVHHTGGGRTWVQIPALDGGSAWYRRKTGEEAPTGIVSLEITPGRGQGWKGLTVHS